MPLKYNHKLLKNIQFICLIMLSVFVNTGRIYAQGDSWEQPPPGFLKGEILLPKSGSDVPRQFSVKGVVSGHFRHLWIIERVGVHYWPKSPELRPASGKWVGRVNEGGWPPEGKFDLLLVDVSYEVADRFHKWQQNGDRTGNYPGFSAEEFGNDARILDTKHYHLVAR